jgi:ATP-binding cassette, subfamily B, bacterial
LAGPSQVYSYNIRESLSPHMFQGFWKLVTGLRWMYVAAVVALGISALMQTSANLLIRHFVDQVLPLPQLFAFNGALNFGHILLPSANAVMQNWVVVLAVTIGASFVGLAALQGTFAFISGRFAANTAESLALRLRNNMYDHIQRLSFRYHDRMQTGELLQRATQDVDAIRRFFSEQAIGIGRIVLLFTINFIALLLMNVQIALISVIVVPVIAILSIYFFGKVSKAYEKLQDQEAVLSSTLQEHLTGLRVVKAFARQDYERDKFEAENHKLYGFGARFLMMHSVFWPLTDLICFAQILFGYLFVATLVINGTVSLGTYLAYVAILTQIINPMRNLGRLIVDMSTGVVSYKRLMEVIGETQESLSEGTYQPTGDLRGDVRFEKLTFQYDKDTPVLHDISFALKAGQSVALLGSTGSGKTSLVSLLPRFYDYSVGSITLDDVELKTIPRGWLRQQIGIVEQEPFLFSKTIRENITYSVDHEVTDDEVIAAAKAAAVHDVILTFPEGYNTLVGERGVTLSGGQKQRLALARTLLKNPRILILDDATSAVDSETEESIREALRRLLPGRTSFVIAHRIQTVMTADLILVMDKGRIIQRGTHAELMQQTQGVYRRIYDLQTRIEDDAELESEGELHGVPL